MTAEQDVFGGTDTPEWNEFRRLAKEWFDAPDDDVSDDDA